MDRHNTPPLVLIATPSDRQPFWETVFDRRAWAVRYCDLAANAVRSALKQGQPAAMLLDLPQGTPPPNDLVGLNNTLKRYSGPLLYCVGDAPAPWLEELPAPNTFLPKEAGAELIIASLDKQHHQHQRLQQRQALQKQRCIGRRGGLLARKFVQQQRDNDNACVVWLGMAGPDKWPQTLGPGAFSDLCQSWFERLQRALKKFTVVRLSETSALVLAITGQRQTRQWFARLRESFRSHPLTIDDHSLLPDLCGVALSHFRHLDDLDHWLLRGETRLAHKQFRVNDSENTELEFIGQAPGDKQYLLIKTQLQQAIAERSFTWLYQPFVGKHDDGQEKYQLMLRVITSAGKELAGKDYVEVARGSGLLEKLDTIVLEQAIRWLHQAPAGHHYCLLVNQDLKAFANPAKRQQRLGLIDTEIRAKGNDRSSFSHQLVIQFDADDAASHMAHLEAIGEALHQAGVTVCLGNFTDTNEHWQALKKLQADWLRTVSPGQDAAFFAGDNDSPLAALVQKAHRLGHRVFVPQVDNMDQMARLWAQDVDYLQGYFIQRPASEVDFSFAQQSL